MTRFEVTVLGSGAAIPTLERGATSHYVNCNERHILIDCGEGTQLQMRKFKVRLQKISHICISHLHGDHFFGLVGYLSTLQLLGRNEGLTIYGPEGLEQIIKQQLEIGGAHLNFNIKFVITNPKESELLFEDKLIELHSIPLKHKVPTTGFLIKEKPKERNLIKEEFDKTGLSVAYISKLRQGKDVEKEDGSIVRAKDVTLPPKRTRSYAFCSDTAYKEDIIPLIKGVDLLYHEATFTKDKIERAKATKHSTAEQAATIAKMAEVRKLIIGHLSARYKTVEKHTEEAQAIFEKTQVVNDGDHFFIY
ncbi:ribonuclease Z [Lishizhenia sp.]|uniref:ribonuclease Z n=1 Tax=Lishizhenia sp. TaxID=2497594 RepID=UPI00299EE340|nr:ribonuclease Z [Lishizhenia sp.]MDX1446146.1 ribonuclease Z [Lishizhenia sp.]